MIIQMYQLADLLAKSFPVRYTGVDAALDLYHTYFWDGDAERLAGALCIIRSSRLGDLPAKTPAGSCAFLCIEDVPFAQAAAPAGASPMIFLSGDTDLGLLFNAANAIFQNISNSLKNFGQFLDDISHGEQLTPFAGSIGEMLGSPIAILDNGFHSIVQLTNLHITPKSWETFLKNRQRKYGWIPIEFTNKAYLSAPLEKPFEQYTHEFFFPVYTDNPSSALIGIIYFLGTGGTLSLLNSELLRFATKAISWHLWRYTHTPWFRDSDLRLMLTNILNGSNPAEEDLKKVLEESSFKADQDMVLVTIETSASENYEYSLEYLQNMFRPLWDNSFFMSFSGDLLVLVPSEWFVSPQFGKKRAEFTALLKANSCYAGTSTVFRSLDRHFTHHYIRSLSAAHMARETARKERYANYGDIALCGIVSQGPPLTNLRRLCDPMLIDLIEYDKHYGTEYFYTLCCYWQLSRDINRVCRYMHLHKNSLYYRLTKIRKLLCQDINDYDSFLQLSLSISILEILGDIPRYRILDEDRKTQRWSSYTPN